MFLSEILYEYNAFYEVLILKNKQIKNLALNLIIIFLMWVEYSEVKSFLKSQKD